MNNTCTLYRFYHFITFSIPICSCNESCVYFVVCISCSVVYYRVYDSFYWTMHMRADSTYYRYVYTYMYMNVTSTFYKMIPMTHLMLGEKQGLYWYWRVRGIHVLIMYKTNVLDQFTTNCSKFNLPPYTVQKCQNSHSTPAWSTLKLHAVFCRF